MPLISSYEIIQELGKNHNQNRTTYLVEDGHGKCILKEFSFNNSSWSQYKSLEREFKILQKLNHPNIPKYIAHFQDDKACYLVQEYVDAPNLSGKLLAESDLIEVAKQILSILKYTSSQDIVHKDIKPANILWNGETAYLIDFGFSSDLALVPGVSSTFLGSPGFIPLEQIYRSIISPQGDLYSLGITLFCLSMGIKADRLGDYVDEDFNLDLNQLQCSGSLQTFLRKLTVKSLKERYVSAEQAYGDLTKLEKSTEQRIETNRIELNNPVMNERETEFATEAEKIALKDTPSDKFGQNYPLPEKVIGKSRHPKKKSSPHSNNHIYRLSSLALLYLTAAFVLRDDADALWPLFKTMSVTFQKGVENGDFPTALIGLPYQFQSLVIALIMICLGLQVFLIYDNHVDGQKALFASTSFLFGLYVFTHLISRLFS